MNAFTTGDFKQAEQCIKLINHVHTLKNELDQECIQLLALRQPTAFDLRFLVTIIKIIYELELVGELAENIAKMAIQLSTVEGKADVYPEIEDLFDSVKDMLHYALNAFARININDISAISGLEKTVDRTYAGISLQLTSQMMEDPKKIRRTLDVLRVARALERIGDHSFHIFEELVYMINGERELKRAENGIKIL
jgi:phosphate transport system protein